MRGRLPLFLRSNAPDFLLVLVLSIALGYAVLSGFESALSVRFELWLNALIAGGFLCVLYAGGWSRKARAASIVVAVAYAACAIGASLALSAEGVSVISDYAVNDIEGNYAIFVFVLLVVALLCFVLSRTRIGVVALGLAGVFCCGVVQFLFRPWLYDEGGTVVFATVLVASIALIVYRRYLVEISKAERRENLSFGRAFLTGIVCAAASTGVAALAFCLVVAPLQLSTPVLKPFEHRIIPPIVDYTGAFDEYLVENPNEFSSLVSEREDATTENAEGGTVPDQEQVESVPNPLMLLLAPLSIFSEDDWSEDFDPVGIDALRFGFLIFVVLVALAVLVAITARIGLRKWRLNRLNDRPFSERVIFLYEFLLSRFKKLGLEKPGNSTPFEYAMDSRYNLVPFTAGTGKVDFVKVTLIYQRAVYGRAEISFEEFDCVQRYYNAFFKNAHAYVGTLKWLLKFWTI